MSAGGWFRAYRTEEAMELLAKNRSAFALAFVIAYRARWHDGFNRHNLAVGEALLGDCDRCGMSRAQYRGAMALLEKHGFATFRATNKGTIAKLTDSRLFCVLPLDPNGLDNHQNNHQNNHPVAIQPTTQQPLTNKVRREDPKEREPLPEIPPMSRKDYDALAALRGVSKECAEWFWNDCDKCNWLDRNNRPIVKVEPALLNFWNSWKERQANENTGGSKPGKPPISPVAQMLALKTQLSKHPANPDSVFHDPRCTELEKADYRAKRQKLQELETQIAGGGPTSH